MSTPDGWDDEIDPASLEGAREVRKFYIALLAVGFTTKEASVIIAQYMVASGAAGAGG